MAPWVSYEMSYERIKGFISKTDIDLYSELIRDREDIIRFTPF